MGLDTRRPPLPAPTDISSMDDASALGTEVATNVTTRTDKTSHTIPEDGSPITISTHKVTGGGKEGRHHARQKSQTSLLIEYFEAGKTGDKVRSKPSVRVKVTPSSKKGRGSAHDAVQITGIGKDRKPSYSRRISLSGKGPESTSNLGSNLEGTEISHSSESNLSNRPPVEVEILNPHGSDLSSARLPENLRYSQAESNVSSMPPDSMLEGSALDSELSQQTRRSEDDTVTQTEHLEAPARTRSRSASRDRLTQKVMQKLGQGPGRPRKSSHSSHDYDEESHHRRRRSSKANQLEPSSMTGAESSLLSSNPTASARSYRSGTSQGSRMTNNPKLLEMVEDTIKRMILPEINQIREDQRTDRNYRTFEEGRHGSISQQSEHDHGVQRSVSKSSSTPHLSNRPKVVLNRDGDDPGTVLSRGDSEYRRPRKSSKSSKDRPSSRRSSGRHSVDEGSYVEGESTRPRSSKSNHATRDAVAGAMAGGALTHAALKHHESQSDVREEEEYQERRRRKKSRSSRSRSASIAEQNEESYSKEEQPPIPPMPMASRINDSDMTRDSILSADTERPQESTLMEEVRTPIREVSRGSIDAAMSPTGPMSPTSSRTPTRTPAGQGIGMSHSNTSITSSGRSPISTKARIAALAAAGLGGAAAAKGTDEHRESSFNDDGHGSLSANRSLGSPAQSVSSLRNKYEDPLIPSALRPNSAASRSSAAKLRDGQQSPTPSSPTTKPTYSRKQSQNVSGDEFVTPLERPDPEFLRDGLSTPNGGESLDDWYERQHQQNDRYRESYDSAGNRASYQTNPYPEDEKRFSAVTQNSQTDSYGDQASVAQDVQGVGANPNYVNHPGGVESNVASLVDPSTLSSGMVNSSVNSSAKTNGTYSDRMSEHLRAMGKDDIEPGVYEGSTLSQSGPSPSRWAAIKAGAAENLCNNSSRDNVDKTGSPRQSEAKSLRQERSLDEPIQMGASGVPVAEDPLPEIGHYDDTKSEISTNPSIIQGPLGGDATGKNTWPYTPSPPRSAQSHREEARSRGSRSSAGGHGKEIGAGLAGAAMGGGAALAASKGHGRQASVEDDYQDSPRQTPDTRRYTDRGAQLSPGADSYRSGGYARQGSLTPESRRYGGGGFEQGGKLTPDDRSRGNFIDRNATPTSPTMLRDEGYDTAHDRSAGALTPKAERRYGKEDIDAFNKAMDGPEGTADPFIGDPRHARHLSADSHGMASPLYDSATGRGMDKIASKDIVALMDHLTVRDAQRNARDTEILVSIVRNATEMRENFEDMKQFIKEQDRMIMSNTDRDAEITVKSLLGGPRPQPPSSPRTPRRESQEDVQKKRKGVLRRALKGLTGGKSSNDLAKVEEMLMQILDNVEDLKHQGVAPREPMSSYINDTYTNTNDSMDSYEKLRAAPDPGYEPEGTAGTNSTPSHSGGLSIPRGDKQQFHSGYNGRPGSENRVSTVMEDDEDEGSYLGPHEQQVLAHQFEHNERMLTPTQENPRGMRGMTPTHTPPHRFQSQQEDELTPKSAEKQRKHKSNSSSIFAGVPKISRWSKTTSSSAAPDSGAVDRPNLAKNQRPSSQASRASSGMRTYDSDDYSMRDDMSLRSAQSFAHDQDKSQQAAESRSMRSQASRLTRTPSPLIPSEASHRYSDDYAGSPIQYDDHEPEPAYAFDDPKYQAHRNSLPLQHPQPRQGTTSRHQNTLETQAHAFGDESVLGTSSDLSQRTTSDFDPAMWGSSGAAALSRGRFVNAEASSPVTLGSPQITRVKEEPSPRQQQPATRGAQYDRYDDEDDYNDWEPQYSNSGFAKNKDPSRMYYSSPLGSGHLLEPIEEVRYSLETDSGHSPEPQVSSARAVDMRSSQRKITGPRPMGARSPQPQQQQNARLVDNSGTVRRKPVPGAQASLDSLTSETF